MATRIKSNQILDNSIVAADLHSAIAINTTQSGTFGSVVVDDITLDGSSLTTSGTNDFTVDSGGKIVLDADTNGDIRLANSAGQYASLYNSGDHLYVKAIINEGDVYLSGKDSGGNHINALRLDMGNGGRATFVENVSVGGDLTVTGNLQVDGTQTVLNTATLSVEDLNITVASGASNNAQADGAGITVGGSNATILYDGTNDEWDFNKDVVVSGELTSTDQLSVDHTGNLTGALKLGDPSTIASETGIYLRTSTIGHFAIPAAGTFRFRDTTPLTYLDIEGTGDIKFYEDNSGSPQVGMTWDYSSGRLGIGTSSPTNPLTVSHDNGHADPTTNITSSHVSNIDVYNPLESNDDDKGSIITFSDHYYDATNNNYPRTTRAGIKGATDEIGNNASGYLAFYTNSSSANSLAERLRITKDGLVGIGTQNPDHYLDVEGGANNFALARVGDSGSDNSEVTFGYFDANASNGLGSGGILSGSIFGGLIQGGENGKLVLGIRDNDSTDSLDIVSGGAGGSYFMSNSTYDRLLATFRAGGTVGIGTASPTENLDIQSFGNDDHVHVVIGPTANVSTNKESHLQLWRTDTNSSRTKVAELKTDIPLPAESTRGTTLWSYQALRLETANSGAGHIVFSPKGSVKMRIDDAGNVGIGSVFTTSSPPDYQLHVKGAGDIKIEDNAGGSSHLRLGASTNNVRDSEWKVKVSGSLDEFHIDHDYTAAGAASAGNVFKITGDTHSIYNTNSQSTVRPTLNLDFANSKTLHKDIIFYRDSIATYYNKKGILCFANRNEPRFDHDPVTGESKGLLLEEQTENLTSGANQFNAWFGQNRVQIKPNATISPSGLMDATKIVDDPDGVNGRHELWRSFSATSGQDYTFSFYAKEAENTRIAIVWYGDNGVFGGAQSIFDLHNGTIAQQGMAHTVRIEPLPNGWYRCIGTATAGATAAGYYGIYNVEQSTGNTTYVGTRGNGVFVYGAQFEHKDFATSYVPNYHHFNGRTSRATYYDKDGVLRYADGGSGRQGYFWDEGRQEWTYGGMIREKASTNLLFNSTISSNLYGDILSAEAKWTITDSSTDVLAPDGSKFTTKGVTGTSGNHWYWQVSPVTYTVGQPYTHSAWVRCADGTTGTIAINAYPQVGFTTVDVTDKWQRVECTFDMTSGLGNPYVGFVSPSDSTTFYFWGWQVEQSTFATSYIPTQGAAATRTDDSYATSTITRPTEYARLEKIQNADWWDESSATALVDFEPLSGATSDAVVIGITTKDLNNGHRFPWLTGDTQLRSAYWSGSAYGNLHYHTTTTAAPHRFAISFDIPGARYASSLDGTAPQVNTTFTGVSKSIPNEINIGGNYANDRPYSGHIKKLAIWNEDVTDVQLQALTEND